MHAAVVVGATGAVGRCVVAELLKSPRWSKVHVLARKSLTQADIPATYSSVDIAACLASGRLVQTVQPSFTDLKVLHTTCIKPRYG